MRTQNGTRLQPLYYIGPGHIIAEVLNKAGGKVHVTVDCLVAESSEDEAFLKKGRPFNSTPVSTPKVTAIPESESIKIDVIEDTDSTAEYSDITVLIAQAAKIVRRNLTDHRAPATVDP